MARLWRGSAALAVLGVAAVACESGDEQASTTNRSHAGATTDPSPPGVGATTTAPVTGEPTTTGAPAAMSRLQPVPLGFVWAYVVARAGEGAVVDTGVSGSLGAIEAGLFGLDLGWDAVGHVIATHLHGDHVGSLVDVMEAAPEAVGYAGGADIAGITSPRPLVAVGDGDRVFDLDVIATPGHTPGHICVLDRAGGFLLAGDALNGGDAGDGAAGTISGPNPGFTADLDTALASVRKLARFDFDAVYFGHGSPVEGGAAAAMSDLVADL